MGNDYHLTQILWANVFVVFINHAKLFETFPLFMENHPSIVLETACRTLNQVI